MKTRVTSIVTLLILVLIGFLLVESCNISADNLNSVIRKEIGIACNCAGAALEGVENAQRSEQLEQMIESDPDLTGGLYDAGGKAFYASNSEMFSLTSTDKDLAVLGKGSSYVRKDAEGNEAIYAIYQFEDGTFLLLSKNKQTGLKLLRNSTLLLPITIAIAALIIYVLISLMRTSRKSKLAAQVMESLDAFSDGRFDKRMDMIPGEEREVQLYNSALGRLQDRVLQQTSRNNAMSMVVNRMQNGIIAVDADMKVILVSSVAKKYLGIIGNPEGKAVDDVCGNVSLSQQISEAMGKEGVYINEVAARAATGHGHRPLRLYISPMKDEGRIVGALAMVEDVTEVKHMEQLRTDFAANVSHELKTPLTSIRGFVETLENGAIDRPEMAHKFLRIIISETERLTRLINDILSISKLESGENDVSVSKLRLDKMAYDVSDMLSIHAGEKEVSVNCHMNEKPVFIIGNNDRVEQLLINLIENAIKYNKPGGSVTVQVFSNGNEANFTVSDTGIGIAEENLPRVFERFYRVDKGRSRQMGGTGLGLAIVKHIVKSMGGEIEVHSKLGEGTEFLVTLPLAPDEEVPEN